MLDSPKASVVDLMTHIKGPDFPTDANIISSEQEIREVYETGRGSIKARARYHIENGEVIVTALPHQASPAKVLEQIAQQMNAKKLPMLVDLRDESDHENPTRLALVPRSNRVDMERLMSHLFSTTDLERNYRVNLNIIGLDQRPAVKSLSDIISEWLKYRLDVVTRRLNYRLDKINERLHILSGLLIAYLNIDEVIRIVREADKPRDELMSRYALTEIQANAILDLRLRQLAKLEEIKLTTERDELSQEKAELEKILGSKMRLRTLIKRELLAIADNYGDPRRSLIIQVDDAVAFTDEDLLTNEPVTVVLSEKGWVRAAKGHEVDPQELSFRSGDGFALAARGRTNEALIFFDSTGRAYSVAPHTLPSARGQGEPLSGRFKPPSGARFIGIAMGSVELNLLMASNAGFGFVGRLADMITKNKAGKGVLTVPSGGVALMPCVFSPSEKAEALVAAVTSQGRLLVFPLKDLPELSRGKGNKLINVPSAAFKSGEETMVSVAVIHAGADLLVHAGQRHLRMKRKDLQHYLGERARRGHKLPRGFQKADLLSVE